MLVLQHLILYRATTCKHYFGIGSTAANAVNETLNLSASSSVMSLSAYASEDEFEDDTGFGDAMMTLDVFEDFQARDRSWL